MENGRERKSDGRKSAGLAMSEQVNAVAPREPKNVYRQASMEVIFGEIWTRPGLTLRQRRWVSLAAAGWKGTAIAITAHVYGALKSGDLTLAEMDEFLLHFACYAGWPRTAELDSVVEQVIQRIADESGAAPPERFVSPLDSAPLEEITGRARTTRGLVLGTPDASDPGETPVSELLAAFEYGHIWCRPQLGRADRRLIALTCLAIDGADGLLRSHLDAALGSGEFDATALREVGLHIGFYAGLRAASTIDSAVTSVVEKRSRQLPQGGSGSAGSNE